MRALFRPIAFIALLAIFSAVVQSQEGGSGGGGFGDGQNIILFAMGSPSAATGGANVSLTIQPTTGYTCTSVVISAVNQSGTTLATVTINNPGATATQNFTGLGSNVNVTIIVNSTFQNGNQFAYPYLEANVTTQ